MNVFKFGGKTASQESSPEVTAIESIYIKGIPMKLDYIDVESKSQRANKTTILTLYFCFTLYTLTLYFSFTFHLLLYYKSISLRMGNLMVSYAKERWM